MAKMKKGSRYVILFEYMNSYIFGTYFPSI